MQTNSTGSSRAGGVGTTMSLVLLSTLLVAAATMFCFQHLKPEIERDLTQRVGTALQGSNVSGFSIAGQDVILAGSIASVEAKDAAEKSAADVFGVSRVINNLKVDSQNQNQATGVASTQTENPLDEQPLVVDAPTGSTQNAIAPTLTVVVKDGRVSTQGIVSDNDTIDRLNAALTGKFGRGNVRNELSSFQGSAAPVWTAGMVSLIDQLDGLQDPILKVTGSDLVIGGTVVSEELRRIKLSTAERLLGNDLNIIDNLTIGSTDNPVQQVEQPVQQQQAEIEAQPAPDVPPVTVNKRPASVVIKSVNQQLTLSGTVADEADAEALRNGLSNLFGQNSFEDELKVDDDIEKATWLDDALSITSEVRDVTDYAISINNNQMLLSGTTLDREQGRDLSIAATEIAGGALDVLNNFSVDSNIILDEDLLAQSLMQELAALPTQSIVFNKNSTTLTDSAQEVLDDVAAAILGYDLLVVEIAGHTDSSGDAVGNLRLSKNRATAVRDYLVEKNVPANRLSPIGYGETAPISDNETDNGRAANRRIEFNL